MVIYFSRVFNLILEPILKTLFQDLCSNVNLPVRPTAHFHIKKSWFNFYFSDWKWLPIPRELQQMYEPSKVQIQFVYIGYKVQIKV